MPTKKPSPEAQSPDLFREAQRAVFSQTGEAGGVQDNLPLGTGPSLEQQALDKIERQENTTFTEKVGAMWRQDGIVDGIVTSIVGQQMTADPKWNPFEKTKWAELTEGVNDDLIPALYETRSEAHAMFVKDLLLQKQKDLQTLSDVGTAGTIGRFALSAVMPDQLLAGMLGGRIAQVVKWSQVSRAAKLAAAAPTRAGAIAGEAAAATLRARVLEAGGKSGAILAGASVGAAANASFEAIRQRVNFEDDSMLVLENALLGAALSVPFAFSSMRNSRRLATAANQEAEALHILRRMEAGEQLSPEQTKVLDDTVAANRIVRDLEAGKITQAEAEEKLEATFLGRHDAANDPFLNVYDAAEEARAKDDVANLRMTQAEYDARFVKRDTAANDPFMDFINAGDPGTQPRPQSEALEALGVDQATTPAAPPGSQPAGPIAALPAPIREPAAPATVPQVDPESPFGPGSIGAAQLRNVPDVAQQTTAFSKLRLDIYAVLNRSENPRVRKLAHGLVKDPIQNDKFEAQGWTASEWKSHFRRVHAGEFFSVSRDAVREAVKARGLGLHARFSTGFDREFHEMVSRVTRGDQSVLAANPDIAPMLSKASAAMRKAYDTMYAEAFAAGVKGTDQISPQDFYVNRMWRHDMIRAAMHKHGDKAVYEVLAGAIRIPGKTGDLKVAKSFLNAVRKLEFSPVMQDIMLHAPDMGTLRRELKNAGLGDAETDSIVDTMFEVQGKDGDAGSAPRLKYRFDLDENFSLQTPAGTLRVSDLLENDSRMLMDTYFNSMAGHTALAKQGITSKADWDAEMREVSGWFTDNATKADAGQRDVKLLNDIYLNITGRPMSTQDFSGTNRFAGAMRSYTRSALLGQLGFAAAFEMKQAAALFGLRAMTAHMPSLGQFFSALRKGHVPDNQLARDIEHIAGFGNEMSMSYARHNEVEDGFAGRTLSGFENFGNQASHVVDRLSGNAGLTAMTRNWAARMATQRFSDFAHGRKGLTAKWRERLVGWGIDDNWIPMILDDLKKHTTRASNGNVETIDYEGWLRDSGASYERFQLLVSRAARDAVQDQDLGETAWFMHSTLGKVFSELKTFFLVAHAKNMLKNLHYRDATAAQVWLFGLLGESLAYSTQTAANFVGNPEALEERLQPERIAAAAIARMSASGITPFLLETGFGVATGGDSLFQPGATTNTDNRTFIPPSVLMMGKLMKAPATLSGLILGNDVTTQTEARSLASILPGQRLLGIANGINYLVETLPKSDPSKGQQ